MDKEILEDFRLKVKDRLTEYPKKSNLPLDNSSPIKPTTICPCCGKKAEIITIYRDIEDINRIMLMLQEDIDLDEVDMMFEEAAESGDEEEINELKTILYDKNKIGFYVRQRKFEVADMRLLAECVYAAKFIAEGQAKRLVDVICEFVSEDQASKIRHNA